MESAAGGSSGHGGYIGSKISLISNADIRYEGILYSINTFESTVALQNVRSFGTEGRRQPEVLGTTKVYQFIVFKGKDIKDLTVCEPVAGQIPEDPAIVTVNVQPQSSMNASPNQGMSPPYQNRNMMGGHPRNDFERNFFGMNRMGGNNGYMNNQNGPMSMGMRGGNYGGRPDMYGNNQRQSYMNMDDMDGMPTRGGRYGGGLSGGRGRPTSRRVVGELPPQPNQQVKKEVSKAFDFEGSNAKFDKSEIVVSPPSTETKEGETTEEGEANATTTISASTAIMPKAGYNKASSFFDMISCETLDRQDGKDSRVDRDKQRQLDCDTFGSAAATAVRGSRPRRGYRRGGMRMRGGFGGYRGGGRGYPAMDYGGSRFSRL